jgi:hypothetical protein
MINWWDMPFFLHGWNGTVENSGMFAKFTFEYPGFTPLVIPVSVPYLETVDKEAILMDMSRTLLEHIDKEEMMRITSLAKKSPTELASSLYASTLKLYQKQILEDLKRMAIPTVTFHAGEKIRQDTSKPDAPEKGVWELV